MDYVRLTCPHLAFGHPLPKGEDSLIQAATVFSLAPTYAQSCCAGVSGKLWATERGAMRVEVTRKLFTVDDYYRMAEAGILRPGDRVELIDGEIIQMSPIGNRHAGCVNRATDLFTLLFRGKAIVTVQNPVRLSQYNEPQPDLVLAKPRTDYYASKHPTADDTLLLLEVADTTLRYDRDVKLPIYAQLGIPEVWIEDLKHDCVLVFRDPSSNRYQTSLTFRPGDSLSTIAFPEIVITVDSLLGGVPSQA